MTNKREIKTTVLADDGETIVLGGLIREDHSVQRSKVPFLGDIPYIGALFSSESERKIKRNLLVFLRPTILLNKGDTVAATDSKYQGLWEVNLGIREKLADDLDKVPDVSERPPIEKLFNRNTMIPSASESGEPVVKEDGE